MSYGPPRRQYYYQLTKSRLKALTSQLTPGQVCLALVLLMFDGKGGCFPSEDTIATLAGRKTAKNVNRDLKKLVAKGLIEITTGKPGRGHSNRYDLSNLRRLVDDLPKRALAEPIAAARGDRQPIEATSTTAPPVYPGFGTPSYGPDDAMPESAVAASQSGEEMNGLDDATFFSRFRAGATAYEKRTDEIAPQPSPNQNSEEARSWTLPLLDIQLRPDSFDPLPPPPVFPAQPSGGWTADLATKWRSRLIMEFRHQFTDNSLFTDDEVAEGLVSIARLSRPADLDTFIATVITTLMKDRTAAIKARGRRGSTGQGAP